jgi:membrane protease YdiL (CAAX protease family)
MRAWIRKHQLLTFFLLTYALSWAYWVPMAIIGLRVAPGSSTTHFPGLLGPAIAAFLTPLLAGDYAAIRTLAGRLTQATPPKWLFLVVSLSPLLFLVVALLIANASVVGLPAIGDFSRYSGLPQLSLPAVLALVLLFNGFGEEAGWRGFALPRLQSRFGPLVGTLILAALWAGWHVPTFLVVETYRSMTSLLLVFGFGLGIVCGAIVLSHVAHLTGGSVLAAALWHASYNMTSATAAGQGLVGAVTTTCVMAWAAIVLLAELRRSRAASLLQVELVPNATPPPASKQG